MLESLEELLGKKKKSQNMGIAALSLPYLRYN